MCVFSRIALFLYNVSYCMIAGKPKPSVTWWKDGKLLDGTIDTPLIGGVSSKFTMNHLFISNVTRALWGAKLECRAQSGSVGKPLVQEVPLDVYCEYLRTHCLPRKNRSAFYQIKNSLHIRASCSQFRDIQSVLTINRDWQSAKSECFPITGQLSRKHQLENQRRYRGRIYTPELIKQKEKKENGSGRVGYVG